jgi:hypothetical protein
MTPKDHLRHTIKASIFLTRLDLQSGPIQYFSIFPSAATPSTAW